MELWEVLDENGNLTGEIMEKYDKKVFERGMYHLGTDVWIINSENKILIQKRLKLITKFRTGNVWIDTYILKCDYDVSKMKFQKDEVSDAKWATWEEIDDLVSKGQFIKHRWEFVSKFIKEEIGGRE